MVGFDGLGYAFGIRNCSRDGRSNLRMDLDDCEFIFGKRAWLV